jgi:hypothetical protein
MLHIADLLSAAAASSLATSWADFTINTVGFSFRNGQVGADDNLAVIGRAPPYCPLGFLQTCKNIGNRSAIVTAAVIRRRQAL